MPTKTHPDGVFDAVSVPSSPTRARRLRRHDESGTALVELALVVPILILFMGVAFNGWNSMQASIRLTSAARAGAIEAASDLGGSNAANALSDATNAVNAEEDTNIYQDDDSSANNYVSISKSSDSISGGGTMNVVTVTISHSSGSFVPFVGSFPVTTHATARYS
jgi:Flp pilus assembly protein TadG